MLSLKHILAVVASFGFAFSGQASAAQVNLISNGSFESPVIATNSYQVDTPTGWNWGGPPGFIFNGTVFFPSEGANSPPPRDGQQYVDIGNAPSYVTSLFQGFNTTNNGTYELTWSDAAFIGAPGSIYSVNIIDNSSNVIATQTLDASHGGDGNWADRSLLVNLTAGNYTLSFNNEPGPAWDTRIDRVSLAAVPVPAAAWLFGSALAGFIPLVKKRKIS